MNYNELAFKFGKYTEITELAFELNPSYKQEGYVRFFICPDVNDYWYVRILSGYNKEYEQSEGCFLLERNNIGKRRGEILTLSKVKNIINNDDGSNWDIKEYNSMDKIVDDLADIFGILNLIESNA